MDRRVRFGGFDPAGQREFASIVEMRRRSGPRTFRQCWTASRTTWPATEAAPMGLARGGSHYDPTPPSAAGRGSGGLPRAGRSVEVPKVVGSRWRAARPLNGPDSRPGAPTTSAPVVASAPTTTTSSPMAPPSGAARSSDRTRSARTSRWRCRSTCCSDHPRGR